MVLLTRCVDCVHYRGLNNGESTCDAFPLRIPRWYLFDNDYRICNNDIGYEPDPNNPNASSAERLKENI